VKISHLVQEVKGGISKHSKKVLAVVALVMNARIFRQVYVEFLA
jgi:hypothetical protein